MKKTTQIRWLLLTLTVLCTEVFAQDQAYLIKAAAVFDGEELHQNWWVEVSGSRINWAGPMSEYPANKKVQDVVLDKMVLMPGLIEGHGHMFLYPYDQQPWK